MATLVKGINERGAEETIGTISRPSLTKRLLAIGAEDVFVGGTSSLEGVHQSMSQSLDHLANHAMPTRIGGLSAQVEP